MFVLVLEKLFDLIDLIFNKGVNIFIVGKLFALFLPTVLPLTLPMAILLASIITFGQLSQSNELTAIRAGGISLLKVFWAPPLFALIISLVMIPFNTQIAPNSNRAFRKIFHQIVQADPLIQFIPRQFFSVKNLKIMADRIDTKSKIMENVIVYQANEGGQIRDRIFARRGEARTDEENFIMDLKDGQFQRYNPIDPNLITHTTFGEYNVKIPLNLQSQFQSTRFRNIPKDELNKLIEDLKSKGLPTTGLEAERALRYAIAFAPIALAMVGIPLATALKKSGKAFGFGMTITLVFFYYLLLISGLTLAEKGILPSHLALWIGNILCLVGGSILFYRVVNE